MICGLKGIIRDFGPNLVELEASGVVYEVHVPLNVLSCLQTKKKEEVYLFVHHHITESTQKLYGFLERVDREFFAALLGVKGIGGSLALSILSHIALPRLLEICESKEEKSLTHIPRVGKSIAATLMLEVNLRRKKWESLLEETGGSSLLPKRDKEIELALQGLIQLGYKEGEAKKALEAIQNESETLPNTAADWITQCLKIL